MRPLYSQKNRPMRIAGFLSGSGTNICKLIDREYELNNSLFNVSLLFSDREDSNASKIGKKYDLPVIMRDIRSFYRKRGRKLSCMETREEFDKETMKALLPYGIDVIAYGGYTSIVSPYLAHHYLGINVHPADLSVEKEGKRVYTGANAVKSAIESGEKTLRSTTHIVTKELDGGPILMRSKAIEVIANQSTDEHQSRLKKECDWEIFPKTFEYLAQNKFSKDHNGLIYFENIPVPKGIVLGEESDIYTQSFEE